MLGGGVAVSLPCGIRVALCCHLSARRVCLHACCLWPGVDRRCGSHTLPCAKCAAIIEKREKGSGAEKIRMKLDLYRERLGLSIETSTLLSRYTGLLACPTS